MSYYTDLSSFYGSYLVAEDSPLDAIKRIVNETGQENGGFYHMSVDDIVKRVKIWRLELPRVQPFYAVKCNNDPAVLWTLNILGVNFDCASRVEMKTVLDMGVEPSRIMFGSTCKIASHVKFAKTRHVKRITFESTQDLHKISSLHPKAELLISVRTAPSSSIAPMGMQFGVLPEDVQPLLALAAQLKLKIVGVAFHIECGSEDPALFARAIESAKQVFMDAEAEGHKPTVLDIGGGIFGENEHLDISANYINDALDQYFPEDCGVEIIAEPGRYMVESAYTFATPIVAKKEICENSSQLFIGDGVHASFSALLMADEDPSTPLTLLEPVDDEELTNTSIWGSSCDNWDVLNESACLPKRLTVGDWPVWEGMGAYTLSASSLDGSVPPKVIVHMGSHTQSHLTELMEKVTVNNHNYENQNGNEEKNPIRCTRKSVSAMNSKNVMTKERYEMEMALLSALLEGTDCSMTERVKAHMKEDREK